jgi:hypothetical protein
MAEMHVSHGKSTDELLTLAFEKAEEFVDPNVHDEVVAELTDITSHIDGIPLEQTRPVHNNFRTRIVRLLEKLAA